MTQGFLTITGRKKEIIVTASGKNVVPALLEDQIRADALVSQVLVVGDNRPFIGALVTLDEEALPGWLHRHGLPASTTLAEAADNPVVKAAVQELINGANQSVSQAEAIKSFRIVPADFTEASGHLTPSMKVKRAQVMKDFETVIEEMYGAPRPTQVYRHSNQRKGPSSLGRRDPSLCAARRCCAGCYSTTSSRSPPWTCSIAPTARRETVPATGVVMDASIFMASIVATVSPALTAVAGLDGQGDGAGERRGDLARLGGVGAFGGLDVADHGTVADHDGPGLAVERAHDGAHALLVRLGDRLERGDQPDALLQLDLVLGAALQPEEVVAGVQDREVAVGLHALLVVLGGTGEEQPVQGLLHGSWNRPSGRRCPRR